MPDCPTCGKHCKTTQGIRIHHTKVHGDALPNLTCKGCEEEFYHPKADRAFCEDCDHRAGENNPNWKDAKKKAECKLCDTTFEYYPSDKPGIYCSECVDAAENFLGTPSYELRDIERVEKECEYCEDEMVVLKSLVDYGFGRFCSEKCYHKWLSDRWEDAPVNPYSGSWREIRRRTLERDDHECQWCGKTKSEIGKEPDVHHIEPVRGFDDPEEAHTLANVICLCPSCHNRAEFETISKKELRDRQK